MTQRGRLINVFTAVIYRLDTVATAAVAGGGFDDEFGEMKPVEDGTQLGASTRREEATPKIIPVQLDRDMEWHRRNMKKGGVQDGAEIVLIMHLEDLEGMSLINAQGEAQFFKGDRVDRIQTEGGDVVEEYTDPPL